MSNVCNNCINCNCTKCPIFSHEVYEELGHYETDETDEE